VVGARLVWLVAGCRWLALMAASKTVVGGCEVLVGAGGGGGVAVGAELSDATPPAGDDDDAGGSAGLLGANLASSSQRHSRQHSSDWARSSLQRSPGGST
jgi:hypothetical protein